MLLVVEPPSELNPLPTESRDDEVARDAWEKGVRAYQEGRLGEAIGYFERTYRKSGRPGPLFSLGQAHRHQYEQTQDPRQRHLAIVRFQQYLEQAPAGPRSIEAERWIAELMPLSSLELEGLGERQELPTRVSVSAGVQGAVLEVDELPPVELPAAPDLEPGMHRFSVLAPGYQPWVRVIAVPKGSTITLEAKLKPLPAQLTVGSELGGELYVDGRRISAISKSVSLNLDPGTYQVAVAKPGRTLFVIDVSLKSEEQRKLDAYLSRTGQRSVSWVTGGLAGGGVIASGVLASLSFSRHLRAKSISDRLNDGSITVDQFHLMESEMVKSTNMKTAAIGVGVSGLVMLTAAVILYASDRPAVRSLARKKQGAR